MIRRVWYYAPLLELLEASPRIHVVTVATVEETDQRPSIDDDSPWKLSEHDCRTDPPDDP